MLENPFIVLQGDPECLPMDHPHYFRGRFQSLEDAIARCEQILDFGFPRWETILRPHDLCHHELNSLLNIYFPFPSIYHENIGYLYNSYSSVPSYNRHIAELERTLQSPRFNRGERVRFTGSRQSRFWSHAGNVVGSEFLDTGTYPDDPATESISVRLDSDGIVHRFAASELYPQYDDTNRELYRERWKLTGRLTAEFESQKNAA
jgi:hypothetical protein